MLNAVRIASASPVMFYKFVLRSFGKVMVISVPLPTLAEQILGVPPRKADAVFHDRQTEAGAADGFGVALCPRGRMRSKTAATVFCSGFRYRCL